MKTKIEVMTHPQRVLFLYKIILRLHRSLPTEMRAIGDKYVREEFRKHKNADKQFVGQFMMEWSKYAVTISQQIKTGTRMQSENPSMTRPELGIPLDEKEFGHFTEAQLAQLLSLAEELHNPKNISINEKATT